MKKLIAYILPLILAISLSGCYTQFQTLNNGQYYGGDYGYAPSSNESAYTEGYQSGWNGYSLYSFRDYRYTRYWSNFYGGYYDPYWGPYGSSCLYPYDGYLGFGYSWNPYFSMNFGFFNSGYYPYGYGGYYNPYGLYGYGYGGYYHHYYSYNYYEVPNSGNNIYKDQHPRSSGVRPVNGNTGGGSYGYSRPERGSTYTRSSGNSGNTTQGTYSSSPGRQPRSTSGSSGGRGSSYTPPERAPRSSGRSAPAPSSRGGSNNGGSRPDRGGNHEMLYNTPGATNVAPSGTARDRGYRPSRNNADQQHTTVTMPNNYSFYRLLRPNRSSNQSTRNSSNVSQRKESGNNASSAYNRPHYNQRSERLVRSRHTYYYHPSQSYTRNSNIGYSRSSQSSHRSTYTVHNQNSNIFSSPRSERAPRVDRSGNNSHNSSSGSRPRRH